jgi:hypothetical protein
MASAGPPATQRDVSMDPIEAQKKKLEEQAARRKSGELARPVRPVPASTPEPPGKTPAPPPKNSKVSPLRPATGTFAKPAVAPATPPGGVPRPAPLPTPPAGVPRSPVAPPTPAATARPPAPASAPPSRPAALPTPPGGIPRGTPSGGTPRTVATMGGAVRPRVVVVVREKAAGGDELAAEVEDRLAATKRWILGG